MRLPRCCALLLALAWGGDAVAAGGSCAVLTPTTGSALFDFGLYQALGADVDRTAALTLACVPDLLAGSEVTYSVSINAGTGNAGSFNPRRMTAGSYGLAYNLYRDPSRTEVWGDGTGGAAPHSGSCAASCVLTIYGRLFGGQVAPSAAYSDQITVSLDF